MYCICQCGAMDSKVHVGQKRSAVSNCQHLVSVFSSLDIFRSLLNCFKYQCYHCRPSPQETIHSPTCYFPLIFLTPSCKNSLKLYFIQKVAAFSACHPFSPLYCKSPPASSVMSSMPFVFYLTEIPLYIFSLHM